MPILHSTHTHPFITIKRGHSVILTQILQKIRKFAKTLYTVCDNQRLFI